MTFPADLLDFASRHWRAGVEIVIISVAIYYVWRFLQATRGARIMAGLAVAFVLVTIGAHFFELKVVSWLLRNVSAFVVIALVVVFQPELRRALASLASHRLLSFVSQPPDSVEVLTEQTFDLANRQLGALIAIERRADLDERAETGVILDAQLSSELLATIFHPKTPLHDGGVIVRGGRIVAAACLFPISQRNDLDRSLGLRHRAGLGLTEEFDAVVIVVSEETGIVSICHHGSIERNLEPEQFKSRLAELLELDLEADETPAAQRSAREDRRGRPRGHDLAGRQTEHGDDRLAF